MKDNLKPLNEKIPENWEVVRLGDVVEIHDNKRIPLSEMERANRKGIYPYCGANGIIDYINDYIFDGEFVLLAEDGGDYSKFGNSAYIMRGKFWVNNHAHILKAVENKTINQFLFYSLNFLNLNFYIVGSTRKKLNQEQMREIKISLPPLPEQRRIAEVLSTVDEAMQRVSEAIAKTERLKRGLMQRLLTKGIGHERFKFSKELGCEVSEEWKIAKVIDLFEVETGTTPSTKQKEYWENGSINWITPTDLSRLNGKIYIEESERKITEKALKDANLTLLPKDSIIISTRAPVGYVSVLLEPAAFNQGCKGLIIKNPDSVHSEFYYYYILSKKRFLENQSSGSTFKELSKDALGRFQIPLPPLPEQRRIAEVLSIVDRKLEFERRRRGKLERIKRGMMNELLTGRKRVKVEA